MSGDCMQSAFRRRIVFAFVASPFVLPAHAETISKNAAVALAESFIAKNGYTTLPREQVNAALAPESLELGSSREEQLSLRFNSLKPKAIGVKSDGEDGPTGWSVAFDFAGPNIDSSICRVVTMDADGKNLVLQHRDGIRSYFAGFD
ncbi:MAG: hypothetical protein EOP35_01910 [Rubrivivax sp.]|nr:MAG: hypothetical protein EOP35_01910 [Rubrivivax sp.]